MNDVSEVSPLCRGGVQVGPELLFDELHPRLVPGGQDGLGVQAALVESPQLAQLVLPASLCLAQPEDQICNIMIFSCLKYFQPEAEVRPSVWRS